MKKILILAANPKSDLRLDREIKDLKDAIKRNQKFDVEIELAVSAESLDKLISENQPFIVHFCGHGAGKQGLVFVNDKGIEQSLPNEALTSLFSSYGEGIECVLLNACYTEVQADAIAEYIPYVIGTSREILDEVAHYFSIVFYKGIAEEQPIETCYDWGYVSIKSNLKNAEIVTSINEINSNSRKLEVIDIDDNNIQPAVDPLKIILKHNKRLESQLASNVSPRLEREFIEEGRRKRYKDSLRNILDNFGQRIIHREKQISDFELKQRETLIKKVQNFWIEGFLKPSLYFNTATDINNEHPSGQILRPLDNLEVIPFDINKSFDSIKDTDITNQISDGQTLLILGEPGSGKTIALLQLAKRLVVESRENYKKPIPVFFNLSSWLEKQQSLEEWLIEELRNKYQVTKDLSQPWIENQELTLLLDGLDEVKANHRNACVRAIRRFSNTHQETEMVVCSRIKDYEALAQRLLLSNIICIQPLSKQQLLDFLENADDSLSGLKTVIKQDAGILNFATTPLVLNMMTWTYHGWSVEQCYEQFRNPEYREFNLFKSYVKNKLNVSKLEKKYFRDQVLTWLNWLAKQMIIESKSIFLIEQLQPDNFNWAEKISYRVTGLVISILPFLMICVSIFSYFGRFNILLVMKAIQHAWIPLSIGISFLSVFIIAKINKPITTSDRINWLFDGVLYKSAQGIVAGLIVGLVFNYFGFDGLIPGTVLGTLYIIGVIIVIKTKDIDRKTTPNEGIWNSLKNGSIVYLIVGSILGSVISIFKDITTGILYGLVLGLICGLKYGGITTIKHFVLRLILYTKDNIPWNYARFLDRASDLLLMKKVGGGYIFYHRMLMEYFANMELEK